MTSTTILIIIYLVSAAVAIFLLNRYGLRSSRATRNVYDALLSPEALEKHAVEIARNHTVTKDKRSARWLLARMNDNYRFITEVYKKLNEHVNNKKSTVAAAEWLLDNFYIIERQVKEVRQNLSRKNYGKLPVLHEGSLQGYPRVYAIALELVAHTDGSFDDKVLIGFIKAYQSERLLCTAELWALAMMIRIALIENIRRICEKINESQDQLVKGQELVSLILSKIDEPSEMLLQRAKEKMKGIDKLHSSYAEYVLQKLKKEGHKVVPIVHYVDEKLVGQDTTAEKIIRQEHQNQAVIQVSMGNSITSFRLIATLDWSEIFEALSQVEEILRQDPGNIYLQMDFESRNYYRNQVVDLAEKMKTSETKVAKRAVECANAYAEGEHSEPSEENERFKHIGYYLLGQGKETIKAKMGYRPRGLQKIVQFGTKHTAAIYLWSIAAITLGITACFVYYASQTSFSLGLVLLAGLAVFIPASDIAVSLLNWLITHFYRASILPKLELKEGIPEAYRTMVVIPTLLPNAQRVEALLKQLEVYYLANREENLYFGIVGDFKDAPQKDMPEDEKIIRTAVTGISALNMRYKQGEEDVFFFFHRHRQYNEMQDKWMGWERKRGALAEFNDLLRGSQDTGFSITAGDLSLLTDMRYVITIDADTKLTMGTAKKMIGTLGHPLNRPIIDKSLGRVVEGYGLIQPRIGVDIESANRSLFARIFAGQGGIDPYTTAVSDVYQDLFSEGIFTGKGIYDVDVFRQALQNTIPDNTVLSHDLLEGSYIRVGLATDVEFIDGYPARYNAYMERMHRWIRGDWQLIPWLFSEVKNRQGAWVKNPLSAISKWKIIDNLRRSLIAPALMVLIALGFSVLPGSSLVWLLFAVLTLAFTLLTSTIDAALAKNYRFYREKCHATIICGVRAVVYQVGLLFIFLPYRAYILSDAIFRTLGRVFFTKKNMLEWVTAADVEKRLQNDVRSFWKRMWVCVPMGAIVLGLAVLFSTDTWPAAGLLFVIWSASPYVAFQVSQLDEEGLPAVSSADRQALRRLARKTWRYFEDFVGVQDNYLPPDNYQEDPPNGIAHRTSPTNIGMLLVSVLAARDFGYIGMIEMAEQLKNTLSTVQKMEKWKGHLYNWYDTRTLEPLRPIFVSTVDSGNFVGYLMTLKQGLKEYLERPIVEVNLFLGLRDTIKLLLEEESDIALDMKSLEDFIGNKQVCVSEWKKLLESLSHRVGQQRIQTDSWWKLKVSNMLDAFRRDLNLLMQWLPVVEKLPGPVSEPENIDGEILARIKDSLHALDTPMSLEGLKVQYPKTIGVMDELTTEIKAMREKAGQAAQGTNDEMLEWINAFKEAVEQSYQQTNRVLQQYEELMDMVEAFVDQTEFAPLFDEKRQLFAIAYNIEKDRLTKSYYDLLASEARQTSFIAIAKREVDQKHWFKLGRNLTVEEGYKGLVSWTGTMFEYLMPLLIMRNYKNTLWDETYWFVIRSQKKYGKQRHVPWGTSESGYYAFDINLNYQYKALGVPGLGLKRGLIHDMVVAPYATVLAIMVDPVSAVRNIQRLEKAGVDGPYGLYEAIDYTPQRLNYQQTSGIVKSFMVHHQGMSLVALNNYLYNNIMQHRFHADPIVKSAESLLQERVPTHVILTKDNKEKVRPLKPVAKEHEDFVKALGIPDSPVPQAHILSNNSYAVMVTDSGSGYSKNQETMVTRWREHALPGNSGMFFYIRNVDKHTVWSAAYAPYYKAAEKYKVIFTPDKVDYIRKDGSIDTHTQIVVSAEDNTEIRCVSLINHGQQAATLEITSYFEVVLTSQQGDLAHPAFSNLFVRTEFISEYNGLLANRRPREEGKEETWAVHTILVEGDQVGDIQYETDRSKFIGRGRNLSNPMAMDMDHPLSDTVGAVLDPVMSLRARVTVEPGQKARISYITGIGNSREEVLKLLQKYQHTTKIERTFELAWTRAQVESRYLGLKAGEKDIYEQMMSQILFLNPLRRKRERVIALNKKGQSGLWSYGISGDMPIVLVSIAKIDEIDILRQLLKAHEYWRMKGLTVDLVVINEDEGSYTQPLQDLIRDTVSASHARDLQDRPGGVFVRPGKTIPEEDKILLLTVARIVLSGDGGTLDSQVRLEAEQKGLPNMKEWKQLPGDYRPQRKEPEALHFDNSWGGFSKDGTEYVIKLKEGQHTPAPWSNVISNHRFGFLVTESGGGYTWAKNSRENKITPWSNDSVSDPAGEVFFLRDEQTGEVWSVTPLPIREPEPYIIRHGYGYSVFEHNSHGIDQQLTMFVNRQEPVKICILKLRNDCEQSRTLTATYYIRPVLGVSDHFTAQYIRTKIHPNQQTLLIENGFNTDFADRMAFMDVSEEHRTFTGDRREFFGQNTEPGIPVALKREGLSNRVGAGYDPCAAMQVSVALEAGEEKEVVFLLGQSKDMNEIASICKEYKTGGAARKALEEVKAFWKDMLGTVKVKTPDVSMNFMLNGWLMYQALSCRIWARSAFYQSGGAYGFRDQLQDVMTMIYAVPEIIYSQILRHAAQQFVEGDVQHWWHPVENVESGKGDKGIRTKFSDDLVWLPYVVADYIETTQDFKVLEQEIGYIEDEPLGEDIDERYGIPRQSEEKSSVYEHCIRAIERALKFGEHGIPLMGSGDWNDGMSTVGNKGKGESVWLGWFLYNTLMRFIPICEVRQDDERAQRYQKISREIAEAIEQNAWDGSWYRRAYFDDGTPMGSAQNSECKIDSLAQSWAVISEAGDPKRVKEAMEALEHYLVKRDEGLIMLLTPAFDKGELKPGYIKGYVPGVRENGGQYTHAAIWVVLAFAKMGDGDKAWELYNLINPINHARTPMEAARYKVEPYVMAADVYAVHPNIGRGGWTWYTGAAGWMYRVGVEHILGLKKRGEQLIIDPCIPKAWSEFGIQYGYRNTKYVISIHNDAGVNKGVKSVSVDGKAMEDKVVTLLNDGKKHQVKVVMGEE